MEKCFEKDFMSYGLRAFEFLGNQETIRIFNKKVTCTRFLIWWNIYSRSFITNFLALKS